MGLRCRFNTLDLRQLGKHAKQLGTFDQIICFEVIEHIKDDKAVVKALAHMLKPGGKLLLTTPNKNYRHLLGDKISATEDGSHVRWGYTHEELRKLAKNAGLVVSEEAFISGIVSQKLTNDMRRIRNITGSPALAWLIIFPFRLLQILDKPLTSLFHYPPLSIAIVAKKR
jgi:2-polyprenyl-3-methyl-5-hydroxy-6-metoxy-1,4-benzoquinol methylase